MLQRFFPFFLFLNSQKALKSWLCIFSGDNTFAVFNQDDTTRGLLHLKHFRKRKYHLKEYTAILGNSFHLSDLIQTVEIVIQIT